MCVCVHAFFVRRLVTLPEILKLLESAGVDEDHLPSRDEPVYSDVTARELSSVRCVG